MGSFYYNLSEIGSGKTAFTKPFIQNLLSNKNFKINSPTYLLDNIYKINNKNIHHIDLYRLDSEFDLNRLDWKDIYSSISLIEWSEKLNVSLTSGLKNKIKIKISVTKKNNRKFSVLFIYN
jgi:tRNA threonylcarbamoyl adenosine modification protein YjeE